MFTVSKFFVKRLLSASRTLYRLDCEMSTQCHEHGGKPSILDADSEVEAQCWR